MGENDKLPYEALIQSYLYHMSTPRSQDPEWQMQEVRRLRDLQAEIIERRSQACSAKP